MLTLTCIDLHRPRHTSLNPAYLLNADSIIGAATLLKLGLWLYCRRLRDHSPAMLALAEDHWNDVLSNLAGIITPTIAFYAPKVQTLRRWI